MLDSTATDDSTTDGELIVLSAAGDHRAFERLVERHAAAVLRLATIVIGDSVSAEDALQQTFLSAYRSAGSFRAESSVRSWLLTIARHAAIRIRTKHAREELVAEPLIQLGIDAGWGNEDPEVLAIAAERQELLRTALRTLSAEDQEVLLLRDMEGLRGRDAAEVLGITERALKSRLHRARLRLAVSLRANAELDTPERAGGGR